MSVDFNDYLYDMYEHYFHNESTNRNMMFDFVTNMPITIIKNDYKVFLNDMAFMKSMFYIKDSIETLELGYVSKDKINGIIKENPIEINHTSVSELLNSKKLVHSYQIVKYIEECIHERKKEALIYINNPFIRFGANTKDGYNDLHCKDFVLYNQNMLLKQFFINIGNERGSESNTFFTDNKIVENYDKQRYNKMFRQLKNLEQKERGVFLDRNSGTFPQKEDILEHVNKLDIFSIDNTTGLRYIENQQILKMSVGKFKNRASAYYKKLIEMCGDCFVSKLKELFNCDMEVGYTEKKDVYFTIRFNIDLVKKYIDQETLKDNQININILQRQMVDKTTDKKKEKFLLYIVNIHLYLTYRIRNEEMSDENRMYLQYVSCLVLNCLNKKTDKPVNIIKTLKCTRKNGKNDKPYVFFYNYFFVGEPCNIMTAIQEDKTLDEEIKNVKIFMKKTLEKMLTLTNNYTKNEYKRYMISDKKLKNAGEYQQLAELCGNSLVSLNGKMYPSGSTCTDGTWYIYRFKYNPYPVDVDLLNRFSENEYDIKTTTIMLLSQMEDAFAFLCGYDIQKEYHIDTDDEDDEEFGSMF